MITVFGSVFQGVEDSGDTTYYIYLAEGRNGKYWAKIQTPGITAKLERMHENPRYLKLHLKGFDYTILQTEKFRGRAASYPYGPVGGFDSTSIVIEKSDLIVLKEDILKSPNVQKELQKEIQKIDI